MRRSVRFIESKSGLQVEDEAQSKRPRPAGSGHFAQALGLVEIIFRDRDRGQQNKLIGGVLAVAHLVDEDVNRLRALATRKLLDGRGQCAVTYGSQRFG